MDDLHVSVKAETLWDLDLGPLGTLNITNSFVTMIGVMALLIIGGGLIARRASLDRPGRTQSAFEYIVEFLLNLVEATAGKRVGRRIFPLIGALFIFIIVANYSGLLPGVGTIGKWHHYEATSEEARIASAEQPGESVVVSSATEGEKSLYPFLRSPNADLNMTIGMALITFTAVQIAGVAAHGIGGRLKHMGDPPFMFPIEVISELSRVVSLSFRLFGNIFAGEVLVTVMVTMSAAVLQSTLWLPVFMFAVPTIFLFLELLFGFIQALVFALLSLIYISLAAAGHDDHDHIHEPADAHPVGDGRVVPAGVGGD